MTALPDNDPADKFGYEVTVWTGYRGGSGTSSKVAIILQGDDGESDPRILTYPGRQIFMRGAVDSFLLTTTEALGNLSSIRYLLSSQCILNFALWIK